MDQTLSLRRLKDPIRAVSLLIALIFGFESFGWSAVADSRPPISIPSARANVSLAELPANPEKLDVPFGHAHLKEFYRGTNGRLLIHIQDPHANASGQKSLALSLERMIRRHGIEQVFVEGSAQDVTLDELRPIASPADWKIAANRLLNDGLISGEEYLNLTSALPMKLLGIEQQALYDECLSAYADLAGEREKVFPYLRKVRMAVEALKDRLYPESLRGYEKKIRGGSSEGDFREKWEALRALAETSGAFDAKAFPELAALAELQSQEKSIRFDKASSERAALLESLSGSLSEEEAAELAAAPASVTDTAEALAKIEKLLAVAARAGRALPENSELLGYREYLKRFSGVRPDRLFDEMADLEDEVYRSALTEERARKLRVIDRFLALLYKAYEIRMSSDEFLEYAVNEPAFGAGGWQAFLNDELLSSGLAENLVPYAAALESGARSLKGFYSKVDERDAAFVQNARRMMDASGSKTAFLIAGGYHTANLTRLLREEGTSYVVLTPQVLTETDQKAYEKILLLGMRKGQNSNTAIRLAKEPGPADDLRKTLRKAGLATPAGLRVLELGVPKGLGARISIEKVTGTLGEVIAGRLSAVAQERKGTAPPSSFADASQQTLLEASGSSKEKHQNNPILSGPASRKFQEWMNKLVEESKKFENAPFKPVILNSIDAAGNYEPLKDIRWDSDEYSHLGEGAAAFILGERSDSGITYKIAKDNNAVLSEYFRYLTFIQKAGDRLIDENDPEISVFLGIGLNLDGEVVIKKRDIPGARHLLRWKAGVADDQVDVVDLLKVLIKLGGTIRTLNELGFVHRDIKPKNILVGLEENQDKKGTQKFRAILTDFGLLGPADSPDVTRRKSGGGTLNYAPNGDAFAPSTPGYDAYGYGVTLFNFFSKADVNIFEKYIKFKAAKEGSQNPPEPDFELPTEAARIDDVLIESVRGTGMAEVILKLLNQPPSIDAALSELEDEVFSRIQARDQANTKLSLEPASDGVVIKPDKSEQFGIGSSFTFKFSRFGEVALKISPDEERGFENVWKIELLVGGKIEKTSTFSGGSFPIEDYVVKSNASIIHNPGGGFTVKNTGSTNLIAVQNESTQSPSTGVSVVIEELPIREPAGAVRTVTAPPQQTGWRNSRWIRSIRAWWFGLFGPKPTGGRLAGSEESTGSFARVVRSIEPGSQMTFDPDNLPVILAPEANVRLYWDDSGKLKLSDDDVQIRIIKGRKIEIEAEGDSPVFFAKRSELARIGAQLKQFAAWYFESSDPQELRPKDVSKLADVLEELARDPAEGRPAVVRGDKELQELLFKRVLHDTLAGEALIAWRELWPEAARHVSLKRLEIELSSRETFPLRARELDELEAKVSPENLKGFSDAELSSNKQQAENLRKRFKSLRVDLPFQDRDKADYFYNRSIILTDALEKEINQRALKELSSEELLIIRALAEYLRRSNQKTGGESWEIQIGKILMDKGRPSVSPEDIRLFLSKEAADPETNRAFDVILKNFENPRDRATIGLGKKSFSRQKDFRGALQALRSDAAKQPILSAQASRIVAGDRVLDPSRGRIARVVKVEGGFAELSWDEGPVESVPYSQAAQSVRSGDWAHTFEGSELSDELNGLISLKDEWVNLDKVDPSSGYLENEIINAIVAAGVLIGKLEKITRQEDVAPQIVLAAENLLPRVLALREKNREELRIRNLHLDFPEKRVVMALVLYRRLSIARTSKEELRSRVAGVLNEIPPSNQIPIETLREYLAAERTGTGREAGFLNILTDFKAGGISLPADDWFTKKALKENQSWDYVAAGESLRSPEKRAALENLESRIYPGDTITDPRSGTKARVVSVAGGFVNLDHPILKTLPTQIPYKTLTDEIANGNLTHPLSPELGGSQKPWWRRAINSAKNLFRRTASVRAPVKQTVGAKLAEDRRVNKPSAGRLRERIEEAKTRGMSVAEALRVALGEVGTEYLTFESGDAIEYSRDGWNLKSPPDRIHEMAQRVEREHVLLVPEIFFGSPYLSRLIFATSANSGPLGANGGFKEYYTSEGGGTLKSGLVIPDYYASRYLIQPAEAVSFVFFHEVGEMMAAYLNRERPQAPQALEKLGELRARLVTQRDKLGPPDQSRLLSSLNMILTDRRNIFGMGETELSAGDFLGDLNAIYVMRGDTLWADIELISDSEAKRAVYEVFDFLREQFYQGVTIDAERLRPLRELHRDLSAFNAHAEELSATLNQGKGGVYWDQQLSRWNKLFGKRKRENIQQPLNQRFLDQIAFRLKDNPAVSPQRTSKAISLYYDVLRLLEDRKAAKADHLLSRIERLRLPESEFFAKHLRLVYGVPTRFSPAATGEAPVGAKLAETDPSGKGPLLGQRRYRFLFEGSELFKHIGDVYFSEGGTVESKKADITREISAFGDSFGESGKRLGKIFKRGIEAFDKELEDNRREFQKVLDKKESGIYREEGAALLLEDYLWSMKEFYQGEASFEDTVRGLLDLARGHIQLLEPYPGLYAIKFDELDEGVKALLKKVDIISDMQAKGSYHSKWNRLDGPKNVSFLSYSDKVNLRHEFFHMLWDFIGGAEKRDDDTFLKTPSASGAEDTAFLKFRNESVAHMISGLILSTNDYRDYLISGIEDHGVGDEVAQKATTTRDIVWMVMRLIKDRAAETGGGNLPDTFFMYPAMTARSFDEMARNFALLLPADIRDADDFDERVAGASRALSNTSSGLKVQTSPADLARGIREALGLSAPTALSESAPSQEAVGRVGGEGLPQVEGARVAGVKDLVKFYLGGLVLAFATLANPVEAEPLAEAAVNSQRVVDVGPDLAQLNDGDYPFEFGNGKYGIFRVDRTQGQGVVLSLAGMPVVSQSQPDTVAGVSAVNRVARVETGSVAEELSQSLVRQAIRRAALAQDRNIPVEVRVPGVFFSGVTPEESGVIIRSLETLAKKLAEINIYLRFEGELAGINPVYQGRSEQLLVAHIAPAEQSEIPENSEAMILVDEGDFPNVLLLAVVEAGLARAKKIGENYNKINENLGLAFRALFGRIPPPDVVDAFQQKGPNDETLLRVLRANTARGLRSLTQFLQACQLAEETVGSSA